MEISQNKNFKDYSPIIVFLLSYFATHFFDLTEATHFLIASILCFFVYVYETHLFKEEYVTSSTHSKKIGFHTGLLTILIILIFIAAWLNWNRSISNTARMALLLGNVVAYIAVVFRAMNTIIYFKQMAKKK